VLQCSKASAKIDMKIAILTPEISSANFARMIMSAKLPAMQIVVAIGLYSASFFANTGNISTL